MTDIAASLRDLAGEPLRPVEAAIVRAARAAGLDYWRTFDLWYRKARRVEDYERDAVAAALDKKRREAARNEFHELKTRLAILESRLARVDEDFHREDTAQIRQQIRGLGRSDRA